MQKLIDQPELVKRRNGGWIALSPKADSLKIGVAALTQEEALDRLSAATGRWKAMLAGDSGQQEVAI
jgi:hypothetical protein